MPTIAYMPRVVAARGVGKRRATSPQKTCTTGKSACNTGFSPGSALGLRVGSLPKPLQGHAGVHPLDLAPSGLHGFQWDMNPLVIP